jgi:hypothetical protein
MAVPTRWLIGGAVASTCFFTTSSPTNMASAIPAGAT